jgi:hypothetical protein
MIVPVHPQAQAVAITGADSGVLITAASAFRPGTSTVFPWIFMSPNLAPCFLVPVDALLHRVDAGERQHVSAGQQRRLPIRNSRPAFSSCATFPRA